MTVTAASPESIASRRLALTGVVGPVLSALVFTVAGAFRPGYSPVRQAISALGSGTGGLLVDAVAVVMGAGLVVFAARSTRPARWGRSAPGA